MVVTVLKVKACLRVNQEKCAHLSFFCKQTFLDQSHMKNGFTGKGLG